MNWKTHLPQGSVPTSRGSHRSAPSASGQASGWAPPLCSSLRVRFLKKKCRLYFFSFACGYTLPLPRSKTPVSPEKSPGPVSGPLFFATTAQGMPSFTCPWGVGGVGPGSCEIVTMGQSSWRTVTSRTPQTSCWITLLVVLIESYFLVLKVWPEEQPPGLAHKPAAPSLSPPSASLRLAETRLYPVWCPNFAAEDTLHCLALVASGAAAPGAHRTIHREERVRKWLPPRGHSKKQQTQELSPSGKEAY